MAAKADRRWCRSLITSGFVAVAAVALFGCNGGSDSSEEDPAPFMVQKASCGSGDKPETDLQGQVSAATRAAGFKGYSCNLQLIGQSKGDGGSWQHAFFADQAGHKCNYYDTASFTANRSHLGVVAIDATNTASPTPTAYLA